LTDLNFHFSQKQKPQVFTVEVRDLAFRVVGILNSEWTEYKKKKWSDEYFQFLDSAKATVTVCVEMKNYVYDERKKKLLRYTRNLQNLISKRKKK